MQLIIMRQDKGVHSRGDVAVSAEDKLKNLMRIGSVVVDKLNNMRNCHDSSYRA